MTTISAGAYTVVVTVDTDPGSMVSIMRHAELGLDAFATYEGFIGGALQVSHDGRRLVQYLQWRDEATYAACRDDPTWDGTDSAQRFMALVEAGRAQVDERPYRVIATR